MSDESSEIGNTYVSARKTNAYFKSILKSKYLFWHLMLLQVRIQENFRGRFNHITVHTLRIRTDRPEQTV